MVAMLAGALLLGWQATVVVFALISFMGLREFLSLAPTRKRGPVRDPGGLSGPGGLLRLHRRRPLHVLSRVHPGLGLPGPAVPDGDAGSDAGVLTTAATFHWGLVTCVYNLGFAALLMRTPKTETLPAGAAGLVFFLLLVTEFNDVAQYVVGKLLGRHKIAPTVSPNKTWEGFLGGWLARGC
jgi:phosphatidate cytidylyltransferase